VSDETSPLVLAQLVEEAELPPSRTVHTTWAELRTSIERPTQQGPSVLGPRAIAAQKRKVNLLGSGEA